jgi:DNA-binding CsgD family transcriptional regulator
MRVTLDVMASDAVAADAWGVVGASSPHDHPRPPLYGRAAERAAIDRLLTNARNSESGVLILRGEPGVGKSALVNYAIERAKDVYVLRGFGVESEADLAFATLHQILRPVLDQVSQLPPSQAAALGSVLGLSDAGRHDRFLIGLAVLSLVAEAAERRPLLCVVDDAHWIDEASADALTFAARRLEAEGVVMLLATRDPHPRSFSIPGLPELRLTGLDLESARALLEARVAQDLSEGVRDHLVESTGGNPLALLEIPSLLSTAQLQGREPLGTLPLSRGLERAFAEQVRRLPVDTQQLLLFAAAEDGAAPAVIFRAARSAGIDERALDPAEAHGIVRVAGGRIEFRHPLVRQSVYTGTTLAERRAAHRALADALEAPENLDRRAWHRAAAALEADADVADELEKTADRARSRSGYAAAATALERAGELTLNEQLRGRRLAAAADNAWQAGQRGRALLLVSRARELCVDPGIEAQLNHLQALIELRCGVPADAFEMLAATARSLAYSDPHKAIEVMIDAGQAASFAGRPSLISEMAETAARLPHSELGDRQVIVDLILGIANILQAEGVEGARLLRLAVARSQALEDPWLLVHAGAAASYLGDEHNALALFQRAVQLARQKGAVGMVPHALEYLAMTEAITGHHASAAAHASEGLRLARETGQDNSVCRHLAVLALVAADQGRDEDCRARSREALEQAVARGLALHMALAEWALGRLDLAVGRAEEACARLAALSHAEPGRGHPGIARFAAADLFEAALRAGRPEEGKEALEALDRFARDTQAPWALALVARCRGLVAEPADADGWFSTALRLHLAAERPFDLARTELLFGEALRRANRRAQARPHLRSALEAFERCSATPWAERTANELRATGQRVRKREVSALTQLTPQELQIARLVAEGLTNREVAAQLFLSPRTVDYHLRKVFTKAGISSRSELIRLELPGHKTTTPSG